MNNAFLLAALEALTYTTPAEIVQVINQHLIIANPPYNVKR